MNETLDLQDIRRRAFRYDAQDGLMELLGGIMFFFVARVVVDPHLAWLPALLIFPMRFAMKFFKERFTYPRIGYVKLKDEAATPRQFGFGVLRYLAVIVFIVGAGLFAFGKLGDGNSWLRWLPAMMGGFASGGFLYAASRTHLPRHYLLFAFSIGWGVACSFLELDTISHGMRAWALGMGLLCLLVGISVFLQFLRTHPVVEEGVADGEA